MASVDASQQYQLSVTLTEAASQINSTVHLSCSSNLAVNGHPGPVSFAVQTSKDTVRLHKQKGESS